MDISFGMWNVRILYRAGSLMTVAKEISKYEIDLVGVKRWRRTSSQIHIFLWKGE
jgi:hypothetical protein